MNEFNSAAELWNHNYAEKKWSGNVNSSLVDQVQGLEPGRSLDIGSGEGADVIWLANQGWEATGVDVSSVAVDRARNTAEEKQVQARFLVADLPADFPDETFDLVTLTFFHSPAKLDRAAVIKRAQQAVAPGGHLLIISHSPNEHRLDLNTIEEEKALLTLDGWDVITEDTVVRADNTHHHGHGIGRGHVTDIVLKIRRHAQ